MSRQVYLDFNATAPARPEVVDAVAATLAEGGNASSVHTLGRIARARVEEARDRVAALVDMPPQSVIFTASGTEANNQALRCCGRTRAIVSAIEHESVQQARAGAALAPVTGDGVVDLDALEALLAADDAPAVVSLMLANNETGVIQPVAEAAALARRYGALIHCDAVQAGGKIPVDMAALGVDFLTLSAHKMAGPQGVGALIVRAGDTIGRFVHGGGQEAGLRAGTENVAGIAGFGVAADLARQRLADFAALADLRDDLERRIGQAAPGVVVFGKARARLPNTAKFATPGLSAETQVMGLDLAGVAISAGSACAAGNVEPPYVLGAMAVPDALSLCAIRVSLGWSTRPADIDRFVEAWQTLYARAAGRTAPVAQ